MKNKKISFVVLGITIGLILGAFFIKSEMRKQVDEFQGRELALNYTIDSLKTEIDSLKTEIVYSESKKILSSARTLSDLAPIAKLLNPDEAGFNSYGLMREFHDDLFSELMMLGQKFFRLEVRSISSQKELKNFRERYKPVDNIVPVYSMGLGAKTIQIYWKKIEKFKK